MTLYKRKYRIESTRLTNRDYAANGFYFVTICTRDRQWLFGNVMNDRVQLSPIGKIAQKFWIEIPQHFSHTHIDAYIIMPNHLHGIIAINRPLNVETRYIASLHNFVDMPNTETRNFVDMPNTETRNFASLQEQDKCNKFGPLKSGSLQAIVHAYKSSVTRWCRKNSQAHFAWQPRFYEHIIRADDSLDRIRQYILNNPANWQEDKNNPANLWM